MKTICYLLVLILFSSNLLLKTNAEKYQNAIDAVAPTIMG